MMKNLIVLVILISLASPAFGDNGSIFGDSLPYVEQSLHMAAGFASVVGFLFTSVAVAWSYDDDPATMFAYTALDMSFLCSIFMNFSMTFSDYAEKKYEARRSRDPRAMDQYRTRLRFPNFEMPQEEIEVNLDFLSINPIYGSYAYLPGLQPVFDIEKWLSTE